MDSKYLNLKTFRRDGSPVGTPMWFVKSASGRLLMQTWAGSAKVKRLRRNSQVEVAPSDAAGKEMGPVRRGQITLHSPSSEVGQQADRLLAGRYGWQRKLVNAMLWLMNRREKIYLEVDLVE